MKMLGLLAGMAVSLALPVAAQDFPSKPIRIIAPFGPGTATDTVARVVAAEIGKLTGQSVVIENKPGAEGQIGAQAAATAAPDGYTMFITTQTTQAINQHVYKTLPYDPVKSFTPVSGLTLGAQIVMVKNELPVKTVAELIALARKEPGKLSFGSGNGSSRGGAELFRVMAKVDLLGVPYKIPTAGHRRSFGWPHRRHLLRLHRRPAGGAGRPRARPRGDQQEAHPGARAVPDRSTRRCRASRCGPGRRPMCRPARRGRSSTN